jgi:hypothetical protein
MERRRRHALLSAAAALAFAAVPLAGPAAADPPEPISGSFAQIPETGTATVLRDNGRVTHLQLSVTHTETGGALTGTTVNTFTCILVQGHETFHCHGQGVFTGSVTGVSGSGTMSVRWNGVCNATTSVCEGQATFRGTSGALVGVHGRLETTDAGTFPARSGTTDGWIHRH